ncbi:MBL fold metallo-hydrolase [Eleftheria terrae]|uniref:MBL fold metallo-hydrolase n=1 Tax=Eleftheria terrae TaxID=1597781 RepID=UPI00263AF43A|nr:MBL fold metallo-hydrolase [Eleftheria terrae]WKB55696.1 MBL fold metallo-hydrolase [Eleftheria terrae]
MSAPKTRFLKPGIAFEPLICRWYAWPYLHAPATLALMVRNRMIPLLESFLDDPDFHRSSARDPSLAGGSFIDFSGDPALAEQLLEQLRTQVAPQLEFAEAVVAANDLLAREGNGMSLEPLYERLPAPLRGLVELGYDLNQHASLRFIEPLLYASPLYDPGLQSVFLRDVADAHRPFILVTPLLDPSPGVLLRVPFSDPLLDELARARVDGLTEAGYDSLCARLERHADRAACIPDLFTRQPPENRHQPSPPDALRIRYFGHASLLLECNGVSVMTDPSIGYPSDHGIERYTFADLPEQIDYVLLTHNHQDHVLFETLLQLRHRIKTVVVPQGSGGFLQDPSLKLVLQQAGFRSVVEMQELEQLPLPGGGITALPFLGEHCDLHITTKLGFQVEMAGQRVMCLADSNNLDPVLYERVARLIEKPDLVFIGMECTGGPMSWLYGDLLPRRMRREHDQSRRLSGSDFPRAQGIVDQFQPRAVLVYAMGAEPWFTHITSIVYTDESRPIIESNRLVDYCRRKGMVAERLYGRREITVTRQDLRLV